MRTDQKRLAKIYDVEKCICYVLIGIIVILIAFFFYEIMQIKKCRMDLKSVGIKYESLHSNNISNSVILN